MVRPGRDFTVVGWSRMVKTVGAAVTALAAEGIEVEVVDARALSPLDLEPMVASVRRTRRAAVATGSVETGGLDGETAASLGDACFDSLAAPVLRIGAPFKPPPAGPELEAVFVPSVERIAGELRTLIGLALAPSMPVLGYDQPAGRTAGRLMSIGDRVARGEAVTEIETERVIVQMEARSVGTLVEIVAVTGAEVTIGETGAWLDVDV